MSDRPNERIAYFNGDYVPESHVLVPFRDRGFRWGDGAFDTERTINGRLFRLKEHIDRLYQSMRYIGITVDETPEEMAAVTEEVVKRNLSLLPEGEDYWVYQNVSRGADWVGDEPNIRHGPTVIVHVQPIPFRSRAKLFRDGIELAIAPFRRTPPESQSPRAKLTNYINVTLADMHVKAQNPDAWAGLLDINGNLNEGTGQNMWLVRNGALYTPRREMILEGVSRETVIDVAAEIGIDVHEVDLDLFDAYTADEIFLSSTSLCVCPVRSIDNREPASGQIPGPVTRRIIDGYKALVDFDFEQQYLNFLDD
tara:strand:- start:2249 stop:3178 length:930 start_codon:yes stop_codon:yes gene_type:complete